MRQSPWLTALLLAAVLLLAATMSRAETSRPHVLPPEAPDAGAFQDLSARAPLTPAATAATLPGV